MKLIGGREDALTGTACLYVIDYREDNSPAFLVSASKDLVIDVVNYLHERKFTFKGKVEEIKAGNWVMGHGARTSVPNDYSFPDSMDEVLLDIDLPDGEASETLEDKFMDGARDYFLEFHYQQWWREKLHETLDGVSQEEKLGYFLMTLYNIREGAEAMVYDQALEIVHNSFRDTYFYEHALQVVSLLDEDNDLVYKAGWRLMKDLFEEDFREVRQLSDFLAFLAEPGEVFMNNYESLQ